MEFEFEMRRVKKEDIRELIFHETLEYHPQLMKDYLNGTERTNFLYLSVVDQFGKPLASLEENGGKTGPVIPLDRKHESLPRSTTVHSHSIPLKEQPQDAEVKSLNPSRMVQAPQRIPLAKPGRVVGPVLPYENGGIMKTAQDLRIPTRSGVLLPEAALPVHSYQRNQERYEPEAERDQD